MNGQWKKQTVGFALVVLAFFTAAQVGYADFAAGASITKPDGATKKIEDMYSGEKVLAGTLSGTSPSWLEQYSLKVKTNLKKSTTMIHIVFGSNNDELTVTPDHIFFLKGETEITELTAASLSAGDSLLNADGNGTTIGTSETITMESGSIYQLAIVGTYSGNSDGHLLIANGIIVGDYMVQINHPQFDPNQGAFPPLNTPADLGIISVVTMADGAQQFPDIAYNSKENNYLAVWENAVFEDLYEIQGAVLSGDTGAPIGDPILLLSDDNTIEAPEIAYNSKANEYLLVARRKTDNIVLGQRVSAQGQPVGNKVEIGHSGGPTFFDPAARARIASVAYNAKEDRYIVAFGEPMSVQILMPDLSIDLQSEQLGIGSNPSVVWSNKSNVYLMAYEDRDTRDTGAENLSAIVIDNLAEAVTDIIRVRDQQFAEESPRVAYNPDDDQFLVVWDERIGFSENLTPQTLTDTIGQIVKADGTLVGQPIKIEAGTAYTLRQDVDYNLVSHVYLVVWKGDPSGDFAYADIFGQFINRDGSLNGSSFLIYDNGDDNTDLGTSEQYYDESKLPVVVANLRTGKFLVVWEESGTYQDPKMRDIMGRSVSLASTPVIDWAIYE